MKSSKQVNLISGIAILLILFITATSFAQTKPKGKEWKVPDADAKKKSAITLDDAAIKAGKESWVLNCKSCHGTKGLGDGTKAEKIEISCGDFSSKEIQDLSDGSLFYKITQGRKPMPAYADKLSDTERWQLVAYIRTLKKSTASATTTGNTKDNTEPKKETTIKKDAEVKVTPKSDANVLKTDSIRMSGAEYLELKQGIEMLKKGLDTLNSKVDSLLIEREKK